MTITRHCAIISALSASVALAGCAGFESAAIPAVLGGTAAATTHAILKDDEELTDTDKILYTGIAGAGGALIGSLYDGAKRRREQEKYQEGYEAGRADAAKKYYWRIQAAQERDTAEAFGRTSFYKVSIPESYDQGGAKLVPHEVTVPIVE